MSDEKVIDLLPLSLPECIGISRYKPITKEELQGYDAILIGCGLSLEKESYLLTSDVLVNANSPLVIDADALTILSTNMSLLKDISVPVILTPHIGEFKRMWPYEEGADLMEEATAFAKAYDVILVLKGPHTIITDGTEHYRIASGNKAMAVGGMGDTLAGMITSFLGQGYAPLSAALLGTYIHGFTGDILARKRYTVMPELLAEQIPCAMYILSQKIEE
jgi:NAD(P)H-hydrate epimerase